MLYKVQQSTEGAHKYDSGYSWSQDANIDQRSGSRESLWTPSKSRGGTSDANQEKKSDITNIRGSTVSESLDAEQVSTNVSKQLIESGSGSRYQLAPEKDSDRICTKKRKIISQVFTKIGSLDAGPMSASN